MKVSRVIYFVMAALFVAGIMVQVFLAGMVVVASRMGWGDHISIGHTLAGPLLFMLVTMYTGRLPRSMKTLNWVLFAVYVLQADVVIFLRSSAPAVSALHPVLALVDFAIGYALLRQAWSLVRAQEPAAVPAAAD